VIARTKSDLADADTGALVEDEIRALVRGSFLANARLVAVSAVTGAGLDALKAALTRAARGLELRLLAHLSGDEALLETFRRGEDIHRATAAKIFGLSPAAVRPDQRRSAKTINFGMLYGMGPFALATQLGVPRAEAKEFIAAYFERFPGIRACLDSILEKARATGGTETIFGRVRPIPGLHDRNHSGRANAERMAMSAPFQGAAADLIKIVMLRLEAALAREIPEARLLLQVHDGLVLECPEALAGKTASLAKATMEGAATLPVPLTVDVDQGRNWAQAK